MNKEIGNITLDFVAALLRSFGLYEDASDSGVQLLFISILNEQ